MKRLVFGGSFDPPHVGHMNLLRNAIAAVGPDEVVVIPAGTAPHKQASATPGDIRLAMCACFKPLFPGLLLSDMELRRQGKSYTVDTLARLKDEAPGAQLYLCIGGDMLLEFEQWREWQRILKLAILVVAGRQPHEGPRLEAAAERLKACGGQVLFAEGPVVPASSGDIRAALGKGQLQAYGLIPPPADAIVRENRLYQRNDPE